MPSWAPSYGSRTSARLKGGAPRKDADADLAYLELATLLDIWVWVVGRGEEVGQGLQIHLVSGSGAGEGAGAGSSAVRHVLRAGCKDKERPRRGIEGGMEGEDRPKIS